MMAGKIEDYLKCMMACGNEDSVWWWLGEQRCRRRRSNHLTPGFVTFFSRFSVHWTPCPAKSVVHPSVPDRVRQEEWRTAYGPRGRHLYLLTCWGSLSAVDGIDIVHLSFMPAGHFFEEAHSFSAKSGGNGFHGFHGLN